MKGITEMSEQVIARFNTFYEEANLIESDVPYETLFKAFSAGVEFGMEMGKGKGAGGQEKPPGEPYRAPWRRRRNDGDKPKEVKDPNSQATDLQYRYLKALVNGNQTAIGMLSREEYDKLFSDVGTFTKGQASDLIDRLVKAGIKPKRNRS